MCTRVMPWRINGLCETSGIRLPLGHCCTATLGKLLTTLYLCYQAVSVGSGVKTGKVTTGLWKRCGLPSTSVAHCRLKNLDTETSVASYCMWHCCERAMLTWGQMTIMNLAQVCVRHNCRVIHQFIVKRGRSAVAFQKLRVSTLTHSDLSFISLRSFHFLGVHPLKPARRSGGAQSPPAKHPMWK